ncbi:NDR1/HIN1-like protein 1 [Olea europaea var. sylvestris]|uniref:NDR1/HIN1-like protein 1 n=1 Tax=Olea europaea var. sylvestris TaxID=158386 RepID=UPI000C1CCCA3|nr:NDR1/HIN1-like protein 1 [Olea europaea var. sylvestris]
MKKDCCHHDKGKKKIYIYVLIATISFIVTVGSTVFIIWLILRPTKPQFILQGATVNSFSLAAPNLLTSNLQISLSSRNPNGRISIYYDKIEVYASYHGQQITPTTMLSSTYQGHKEMTVWSPILCGNEVPLAPYLAVSLNQEQMVGMVLINFKMSIKVRWRVGKFVSGTYHLYVNCPAYINSGNNNNNAANAGVGNAIQFKNCHVDV